MATVKSSLNPCAEDFFPSSEVCALNLDLSHMGAVHSKLNYMASELRPGALGHECVQLSPLSELMVMPLNPGAREFVCGALEHVGVQAGDDDLVTNKGVLEQGYDGSFSCVSPGLKARVAFTPVPGVNEVVLATAPLPVHVQAETSVDVAIVSGEVSLGEGERLFKEWPLDVANDV